jgi:hypothetical protein
VSCAHARSLGAPCTSATAPVRTARCGGRRGSVQALSRPGYGPRTRTPGTASRRRSTVRSVRSKTRAVARRERSAGSRCWSSSSREARATSWLIGACSSGRCSKVSATHGRNPGERRIRPRASSIPSSHTDMGESQSSVRAPSMRRRNPAGSRGEPVRYQNQTCVSSRYGGEIPRLRVLSAGPPTPPRGAAPRCPPAPPRSRASRRTRPERPPSSAPGPPGRSGHRAS